MLLQTSCKIIVPLPMFWLRILRKDACPLTAIRWPSHSLYKHMLKQPDADCIQKTYPCYR